jgi:uridine kinase
MKLYFIGGASGSGKTAVMPNLKELLGDNIAVYDFDDIGVPEAADKKWRQESTEKWLQKLLSNEKETQFIDDEIDYVVPRYHSFFFL